MTGLAVRLVMRLPPLRGVPRQRPHRWLVHRPEPLMHARCCTGPLQARRRRHVQRRAVPACPPPWPGERNRADCLAWPRTAHTTPCGRNKPRSPVQRYDTLTAPVVYPSPRPPPHLCNWVSGRELGMLLSALVVPPLLSQHSAFLLGAGLTSCKTALADVVTQHVVQGRPINSLDVRRVAIFAIYGLIYLGCVQYLLYSVVFPRIFPRAATFAALPFAAKLRDLPGQRTVICQVALDQGLHWPFFAIPAFHLVKACGEGVNPHAALLAMRSVWLSDVRACWAVWVPAGLINFSFMPVSLRVTFAAFVSFWYTCFVSWRRGAPSSSSGSSGQCSS